MEKIKKVKIPAGFKRWYAKKLLESLKKSKYKQAKNLYKALRKDRTKLFKFINYSLQNWKPETIKKWIKKYKSEGG